MDKELEKYRVKYPDEEAVTISISTESEIKFVEDKPVIKETTSEESILLTKRSAVLNSNQVGYSFFNKLVEAEAYTLVPVDNKYDKMEVSDIEDYKEDNSGIFYDDSKVRKFIFPGLKEGAKTIFKYTIQHNEPWLWGNHYFTNGSKPVENMIINLVIPDKIKVVWKVINDDSSKVIFTQTKKGKKTIYHWEMHDIPKLKVENDGPNFKWYVPVLMLGISEFKNEKDEIVKMMDGHNYLYAWYRKMISKSKNEMLPEIKLLVDSLLNPTDSEKEKVEKIYSWTQNHISYVAFEDGYAGFTPANSQDVFNKRYGDCKGKANLLKEMLGVANIKSYLTWIGTTHLPFKRDDIPGKPVDNHMIVTYIAQDGTYYFLDPTSEFITMDFPSVFIQGKEALIGLGETDFKIMKVPYVDKSKTKICQSMNLKIDSNKIVGNGIVELFGYNQFLIGSTFRNLTYDKQKIYFNSFFAKGNNKLILDTLIIKDIDSPKNVGKLIYNCKIPNYINTYDNKIFINLNIDKIESYKPIKNEGRQCDVFWRYQEILTFKYIFDLPEGYEIESIPPDNSVQLPEFGFTIKYTKKDRQIVLEKDFYSTFSMLDRSKIPLWNNMVKQLDKSGNQSIVLKKSIH